MKEDRVLDTRGTSCPIPVVKTKLELEKMKEGQILKILADDPGAKADFPNWSKDTGNELLKMEEEGKTLIFYIKKK